jgi:hypothetical protein
MINLTLAVGCLGAASLFVVIPLALHKLSKEVEG